MSDPIRTVCLHGVESTPRMKTEIVGDEYVVSIHQALCLECLRLLSPLPPPLPPPRAMRRMSEQTQSWINFWLGFLVTGGLFGAFIWFDNRRRRKP